MASRIKLGDLSVDVTFKDIKNLHLTVHPPAGRVSISAPRRMELDAIRVFAISRLEWIKKQRRQIRDQAREPVCEYVDRESHYVWGRRYLLSVHEPADRSSVELKPTRLVLHLRAGTSSSKRRALVDAWYRDQLRRAAPPLIAKWERRMSVEVARFHVRRMKTRWGSCNPATGSILLNTDLAKKPRECLEYIVVHEMVHLLEPTHNARFVSLMDRFMPLWKNHKAMLNRLPVRHDDWDH
jgi:predicted metal-dependent hydrolase